MRVDSEISVIGGSIDTAARVEGLAAATAALREESMPFTIRIARSDEEIEKAVQIRHAAYARHVPAFAENLRRAEAYDYDEASVVLLAESKLDGAPLGTMRIQTNQHRRLALEGSVQLPVWLKGKRLAEATRLGVSEGRVGRVVKMMLFKAYFLYCLDTNVDWMVICARSPLDRQYDALLFRDVYPEGGYMPMRHIGGIAHRVMAFEPISAELRWAAAQHPLFNFIFRTQHSDIEFDTAGMRPRNALVRAGSIEGESVRA
jgi:hypothetical protein